MEINQNPHINNNKQNTGLSYNAVQINISHPTVNAPQPNVIYNYPRANEQIYYSPVQHSVSFGQNSTVTSTPSGIGTYKNYSEIDQNGNEVTSVKYSQSGSELVQTTKIVSYDGSTIDRVIKNDNGKNSLSLCIKDENGHIILQKEKSVQKIDNDTSITTVNGKTYTVTGMSDDILSIEHNGNITTIDLNKLVSNDLKVLPEKTISDWMTKKDGLTKEDKEKLFKQLKDMPADDLLKLNKIIDFVYRLQDKYGYESFYTAENNSQILVFGGNIGNATALHELGHAVNNKDIKILESNNQDFIKIREIEKDNFIKRYNKDELADKLCVNKFIDMQALQESFSTTKEKAEERLRNETFAEAYSILNNPTITPDSDKLMSIRPLGLMKAFPKTIAEVENLSAE